MRTRLLFRLAIASAALWLTGASMHLVSWERSHAELVGFFPSAWRAIAAIALSTFVLAGLALLCLYPRALDRLGHLTAPLEWLILPILPFVPGVSSRLPLLLVFAGPMKWALLAVVLIACLARYPVSPRLLLASRSDRLVFALSLTVFLAVGWRVTAALGPTGDEPHYLILTESLLADGDLRVENNYADRGYASFYRGNLRPHLGRPGLNGARYSVHAPGTAVVVLPGYALAGYRGAVVTMAVLTAVAASLIYLTARAIAGPSIALLIWLATAFTVPLGVHSWMVYPEVPAAVVTALVAFWLVTPTPQRTSSWLTRGAVLAVLPWLHLKFVPLMICAAGALILRGQRRRSSLALLGPILLSGLALLMATHSMYGVINPLAPYLTGGLATQEIQPMVGSASAVGPSLHVLAAGAWTLIGNVPRGVLGLLLDQEYGLLTFSPVFLLVVPGVLIALRAREERAPAASLVTLSLSVLLTVAGFEMWWGGASAPARFLVPIIPLIAPMLAVAVRECRDPVARAIARCLVALSVLILVPMVGWPASRLMYDDHDGSGRLIRWMQGPAPLTAVLPSFAESEWTRQLPAILAWLFATAIGLVVTRSAYRRFRHRMAPLSAVAIGSIAVLGVASVVTPPFMSDARREQEVRLGKQDMMFAYRPQLTVLDFGRWRTLSSEAFHERSALVFTRPANPDTSGHDVTGPFLLPPGRFEMGAWFDEQAEPGGEILVSSRQNGGVVGRSSAGNGKTVTIVFTLNAPESSVMVVVNSSALARSVRRVTIVPQSLVRERTVANDRRVE